MNRYFRVALIAVGVYALLVIGSSFASGQPTGVKTVKTSATSCSSNAEQLLGYINKQRAAIGSPVLSVDSRLVVAAQSKSYDMEQNGYYGHKLADNSDPFRFFREQGVKAAGSEELDVNGLSAKGDWLAFRGSQAHYKSLMGAQYTRIGISERCTNFTITKATGPDDNSSLIGVKAKSLTVIYLATPEPQAQAQQTSSNDCTTLYTAPTYIEGIQYPGHAYTSCS
jgi:hypothetical protein